MNKEYSKDDILKSFKEAPEAVRKMLSSVELADIISEIAEKNSLSDDVMVKIAEYNRNLLLGLTSPAEVLGNFIFAGIPAKAAQEILEELNQKVFIPTHKEVTAGKQPPQEEKHVAIDASQVSDTEKYSEQKPITVNTSPTITHEVSTPKPAPLPTMHIQTIPPDASPHKPTQQSPSSTPTDQERQTPPTENVPIKRHVADPYRESFD